MATPPPDSVSVQGIVGDVAFTEEIPRPLGNKKIKRIKRIKRITISEAKGARLDLDFNMAIAAMVGYNA
jgi:hypothetical protein